MTVNRLKRLGSRLSSLPLSSSARFVPALRAIITKGAILGGFLGAEFGYYKGLEDVLNEKSLLKKPIVFLSNFSKGVAAGGAFGAAASLVGGIPVATAVSFPVPVLLAGGSVKLIYMARSNLRNQFSIFAKQPQPKSESKDLDSQKNRQFRHSMG